MLWVLEQYGFDDVNLTPADLQGAVALADRIDVLIIADEARGLLDGYAACSCVSTAAIFSPSTSPT